MQTRASTLMTSATSALSPITMLKQASVSLTIGVFIGSALTSGIAFGVVTAYFANARVLRRLQAKAISTLSAARDAALSTREGQALHRALLNTVGDEDDEASAASAADLSTPINAFSDPRLEWAQENGAPGGDYGGRWKVERVTRKYRQH